MSFKNINLSKEMIAATIALAMCGCASNEKADNTNALEKELSVAKNSLDSVSVLHLAAADMRDMYQHKCDSLCPVVGVYEDPSVRAAKDAQWRQYRDSVSKYRDAETVQKIARDWAQFRVDSLKSELEMMKNHSR